jgi:hypothetical protein
VTDFALFLVSALRIRNRRPFAALRADADRHTLWRDGFRTPAVGETGVLSLLANDVVE